MDEFDYLNGTLHEWVEQFPPDGEDLLDHIADEYLSRFEAALHKNNARKASV